MTEYMDYNTWLEKEVNNLERVRDIKHKALKSSHKRIKDLEEENEQLKKEIDDFYYEKSKLKESDFYIKALKNQIFICYLKEQQKENEKTKLSNELTLKIGHNHIQTLEINELKKEIVHLKECNLRYRNHNELLESIIGIWNNVIE